MHTALYVIWFIIPAIFFTIALWAKLEEMSGHAQRQNTGDYIRQGGFVLVCVLLAVFIDQQYLRTIVDLISPDWIPFGFYEIMLLPVILYLAASMLGPSKQILISKAPRVSSKDRRRK